MNWRQGIDRLDLYDHRSFYQQIHSITAFELDRLIDEWHGLLLLDSESSLSQLVGETCLVSRLEQAWTQDPMNLDGCADDRLTNLVQALSLSHKKHI
jgi:hypothetical protein